MNNQEEARTPAGALLVENIDPELRIFNAPQANSSTRVDLAAQADRIARAASYAAMRRSAPMPLPQAPSAPSLQVRASDTSTKVDSSSGNSGPADIPSIPPDMASTFEGRSDILSHKRDYQTMSGQETGKTNKTQKETVAARRKRIEEIEKAKSSSNRAPASQQANDNPGNPQAPRTDTDNSDALDIFRSLNSSVLHETTPHFLTSAPAQPIPLTMREDVINNAVPVFQPNPPMPRDMLPTQEDGSSYPSPFSGVSDNRNSYQQPDFTKTWQGPHPHTSQSRNYQGPSQHSYNLSSSSSPGYNGYSSYPMAPKSQTWSPYMQDSWMSPAQSPRPIMTDPDTLAMSGGRTGYGAAEITDYAPTQDPPQCPDGYSVYGQADGDGGSETWGRPLGESFPEEQQPQLPSQLKESSATTMKSAGQGGRQVDGQLAQVGSLRPDSSADDAFMRMLQEALDGE
ncbi:uncharacterized protein RCC_09914 [Ramularia collo-cygni]|uniref:Uncharacterized protein n=1 Tax=Ramularia collo-cygni TaxID=112498 RepID=A0A2D3V1J6_9PEZI|nr:uncharacterized protein RCC_09914 [Ramularia collo-cygni]CZT24197.1 uncharacterized protein RCC_09914 [Ramularia collo-cygni]